jgi:hypothetical protein
MPAITMEQADSSRVAIGYQPIGQVLRANEIQQDISQGQQLLQRQGLDLGSDGGVQWAAAAVELPQDGGGRAEGLKFLKGLQ